MHVTKSMLAATAALSLLVGGGSGRVAATIAGSLLGGYIGGNVGRWMDDNDRYRTGQALERHADPPEFELAEPGHRVPIRGHADAHLRRGRAALP